MDDQNNNENLWIRIPRPFVTVWATTSASESITLPLVAGGT
jgi:hypothetical protein